MPLTSTQTQSRKDNKRIEAQMRQERARRSKPIQQKINQAEQEMEHLNQIQTECETFLAQEAAYADENKAKLQQILAQLVEVKVRLCQVEESWLEWQQRLEQVNEEINKEYAGSFSQ